MENNNLNCFGGSSISGETTIQSDVSTSIQPMKWDGFSPIRIREAAHPIALELVSVKPMEQSDNDSKIIEFMENYQHNIIELVPIYCTEDSENEQF